MQESPGELLKNRVAIVTGGASGIGKAICFECARHGARIAVADLDPESAARAVSEIEDAGGTAHAVQVDVRDPSSTEAAAAAVCEHFGTIDILVNCAGINKFKRVDEFSVVEWESIRSVNLDGPWHFCQAVIPTMMAQRYGKIVNIASTAGIRATPHAAPYSTAKHGLIGLTRNLAVDLGLHGINANCVCPASVDSPLLRESTSDEYREKMVERLPLGRLGQATDIAKAVVFLASDDAAWITGAILPVDGGLSCCNYGRHQD
jgi:2-hydroxycyclohexanecarboxyl-CoA dehydrogenase